jgi:hypothetical protein
MLVSGSVGECERLLTDDGMEDGSNGVDDGHQTAANGAQDAFDLRKCERGERWKKLYEAYARNYGTHF